MSKLTVGSKVSIQVSGNYLGINRGARRTLLLIGTHAEGFEVKMSGWEETRFVWTPETSSLSKLDGTVMAIVGGEKLTSWPGFSSSARRSR